MTCHSYNRFFPGPLPLSQAQKFFESLQRWGYGPIGKPYFQVRRGSPLVNLRCRLSSEPPTEADIQAHLYVESSP
jgi:hypothetical protein